MRTHGGLGFMLVFLMCHRHVAGSEDQSLFPQTLLCGILSAVLHWRRLPAVRHSYVGAATMFLRGPDAARRSAHLSLGPTKTRRNAEARRNAARQCQKLVGRCTLGSGAMHDGA